MQDRDYPEILQDLRDSIKQQLISAEISDETATQIAHNASEAIRHSWGGMLIYICKGHGYELSQRDKNIWDDFSGRNHHELLQIYQISLQHLYRIIRTQKQNELRDRQEDLFK